MRLKLRHLELYTGVYHLYECVYTIKEKKQFEISVIKCVPEWPMKTVGRCTAI